MRHCDAQISDMPNMKSSHYFHIFHVTQEKMNFGKIRCSKKKIIMNSIKSKKKMFSDPTVKCVLVTMSL